MLGLWSAPTSAAGERLTPSYLVLVTILSIMLGGVFPAIYILFSQTAVWLVWLLLWIVMMLLWQQVPIHRLLLPMVPMLFWVMGYICWGILAASYPIFESGYRLAFRFVSIAVAIAIITSHQRKLTLFANATQWVLVFNLLVTFILMQYPQYQNMLVFNRLNVSAYSDRFAGLWGDANEAGLVSLLILVLSYWAKRWVAWIGRISGFLIIYLTASRTAIWILVGLIVLYFVIGAGRRTQVKLAAIFGVLIITVYFYVNMTRANLLTIAQNNQTISRVLDITESKTRGEGNDSRIDLMKKWMFLASIEPWYGYGLYSLEGDESRETGIHRGFPGQGTHNLYLGLFIDVGFAGLFTFLTLIGYQLIKIYRTPLLPAVHRTLFALCFITLIFSNANHQMLLAYPGWIAFSLIFILPTSPALRQGKI